MKIPAIDYEKALKAQLDAVQKVIAGTNKETVFLLTHPPTITLGRKADPSNIIASTAELTEKNIKVIKTTRGGDVTFHCEGQLICYPIINIAKRKISPRRHIENLEEVMLSTVSKYGLKGIKLEGKRGVFINNKGLIEKIGAIGVAISRGVTYHGFALNVGVNPDMFNLIVPCGLMNIKVTSMHLHTETAPTIEEVAEFAVEELKKIYRGEIKIANEIP